ncbi:MAG: FAD/NAD(P)-binding protein [Candidatus Omnitrophota bacterium]
MNNIYEATPIKVSQIRKHTPSEWSFLLAHRLEEEPGKFVMVSVPGAGEVPITVSGFTPKDIEITVRNIGKVTSHIFKVKRGDYLYIRGPYGNTFSFEKFIGKRLLIIAGGSGIAAVKPVVEYYYQHDKSALRKLDLLVGFKSPKHILFRRELEMWAKKLDVKVTVSTHEDEEEEWQGGIGFVVDFVKHVKDIGEGTHCILVGSPMMMTNTVRELFRFNVKQENVWLSFERHMKCGLGKCGHCRIRDKYVCTDGPVFNYEEAKELID